MILNLTFLIQNSCFAEQDEKITIIGSKKQAEVDWVEKLHLNVSDTVFLSAIWFDSFFADDEEEQVSPKASARIRLGWEPKAGDFSEFKGKFRLRVKLPHFKDKLDLILSDDEQDNINQLPLETVNSSQNIDDDSFAAAVRFVHKRTGNTLTDTRLGLSSGDVFFRARHRRHLVFTNDMGIKVEPSVYYYLNDGVGAKLLTEYEYQINLQEQLRVNYSIRGSESFSGIRWKHGLFHLKQFSLSDAGALGLVVEGERNGDRGFIIDKYTLSYRYRFNAYKEWLFFDVEPFMEWSDSEDYNTVPGIALRVEGYFSKS
ncbi:hypothetical protein [Thalassotalea atypica]|uniref:hypothetical protein n=1 Tax=Thalassotalea atypica TaxID=2054316 RepID=UPI00257304C0|nr:hypothetical protein [Thalassotalea atypica]